MAAMSPSLPKDRKTEEQHLRVAKARLQRAKATAKKPAKD